VDKIMSLVEAIVAMESGLTEWRKDIHARPK